MNILKFLGGYLIILGGALTLWYPFGKVIKEGDKKKKFKWAIKRDIREYVFSLFQKDKITVNDLKTKFNMNDNDITEVLMTI